jgi:hypothetical protein
VSCQELVELVTEYFEGTLTEAQRAAFDEHLSLCPGCLTYVEQMRTTIAIARDTQALEREPNVQILLEHFRDWRRSG